MRSSRQFGLVVSLGVVFAFAVSACDQTMVMAPDRLSGNRPLFNVGDPDYQCPREVDPAECEELTASERQDLWLDIEFGIKWYDPNLRRGWTRNAGFRGDR